MSTASTYIEGEKVCPFKRVHTRVQIAVRRANGYNYSSKLKRCIAQCQKLTKCNYKVQLASPVRPQQPSSPLMSTLRQRRDELYGTVILHVLSVQTEIYQQLLDGLP